MNECYSCGISEDKAILYEGIHKSFGVVKICRKCYFKDKLPLVETKRIEPEEVEKRLTVRERLSAMAGIKSEKKEEFKRHVFTPEDIGLKDIIEKNLKKNIEEGPKQVADLIDNFNWVIMRKRRSMKFSREELAKEVMEQPITIEALEKGSLPRDYLPLIKKIENYLEIRLLKDSKTIRPEGIIAETRVPSGILISEIREKTKATKAAEREVVFRDEREESFDLEELNLDKIREISGEPTEKNRKKESTKENDKALDELSDDEINDLIFGRKK